MASKMYASRRQLQEICIELAIHAFDPISINTYRRDDGTERHLRCCNIIMNPIGYNSVDGSFLMVYFCCGCRINFPIYIRPSSDNKLLAYDYPLEDLTTTTTSVKFRELCSKAVNMNYQCSDRCGCWVERSELGVEPPIPAPLPDRDDDDDDDGSFYDDDDELSEARRAAEL